MEILADFESELRSKVLETPHFLAGSAARVNMVLPLRWMNSQCDLLQSVFKLQLYYKSQTSFSQSQAPRWAYLSHPTTKTRETDCFLPFWGTLPPRSRTSHSAQLRPNPPIPALQSTAELFLEFEDCFNFSRAGPAANFYNKRRGSREHN